MQLSKNTRDESVRWVREHGLDISKKKEFTITMSLSTRRVRPPEVYDRKTPLFWLMITDGLWWMSLDVPPREFAYTKRPGEKGIVEYVEKANNRLKIKPPKKLEVIPPWIREMEKKFDLEFRRDLARYQSNVKHGAAAMAAWIAEEK